MTDQRGENHGAFTTATIFDDAVYLSEALNLPVNQNEEDVDAELALLARESGIQDPYRYLPPRDISRALSTVTLDSDHRSSMSIHSQETQSTSFTSAPSRTSRDHVCGQRMPPKIARAMPSQDSSSQASSGASQAVDQDDTTSTKSFPQSVMSSTSSVSSPTSRRKRGSLFGMFRRDPNSCTSRSHHTPQGRGRGPKLGCGHALSEYAIRVHVQDAIEKGGNAVPSCCSLPIPREILELVLAKEEADLVTHTPPTPQAPEANSSRDSGYCEKVGSSVELGSTSEKPTLSATSTSLPNLPSRRRHEAISLDSALAREAFKSFRTPQKEQFERVAAFEASQRKALLAHHQSSLQQLAAKHETDKTEKLEQHVHDLEHLEEVQIMAEHDLRKAHDLETQNVALALKHMKAYCLRDNSSHPEDTHVVTEEDFKKLDRQRATQDGLPRKHENAINVLRARQERETKNRLQKQQTELTLMDEDYQSKKTAEETEYTKELEKLEAIIEERRKRLMQRWDLKFEIWRHDWEEQHGTTLSGRLEHESWPLASTYAMRPIPESSSLAPYLKLAA